MGLLQGAPAIAPQSAVGTNGGATITIAAPGAGSKTFLSGIQASGDAAALVTIESPANTVLFKMRMSAAFDRSWSFPPRVMMGTDNGAVVVKVSASTSNSEVNAQGFTVPS